MDVAALVGRVVESVWLRPDGTALAIVFDDSTQQIFEAEGYCCASAWIEAVDDLGFKGRFVSAGSDPDRVDSSSENAEYNMLDINFYCFKTEHGRLLVELRTTHNGFYSGNLLPRDGEIGADCKRVE